MTTDIDWAAAWKEEQQRRNNPDNAEMWNERAKDFAKTCGTSPYAAAFLERAAIRDGETVLDMGCGSGTLALPLARAGHEVYACDFSQGMLDALMEAAFAEGIAEHIHPMLLAWDDDWNSAGVPVCDVALASRSIATADMQASLAKLDARARGRVCVTLTTGLSPRVDHVLLEAARRELPRYPDCVFAFNILWSMGIRPDLSYIDSARTDQFESFDAAIEKNAALMKLTDEEHERLVSYSKQHLHEQHTPDGETCWEYDHQRVTSWAFLAWDK